MRPTDMVKEAIKAGRTEPSEIISFVREKYNQRLLPAVVGRLLHNIKKEGPLVPPVPSVPPPAVTAAHVEKAAEILALSEEEALKDVGALIRKYGIDRVRRAVEVAGWFVG